MQQQAMQPGQPVPATLPLTVTLEAQQWNAVMAALSDAPYRIAAPLIQAISDQLQQQAALPPSPDKAVGNGVDHHPPAPPVE